MNVEKALVWFRRDLRDTDHAALSAALLAARQVHCAFVFDTDILAELPSRQDRRVDFIRESVVELDAALRARGGGLIVRHGRATDEIPALAHDLGVGAVYANRDYEPAAKARDRAVGEALAKVGVAFETRKDQAIFDGSELLTASGNPYTVFTPYKNAWRKRLSTLAYATHRCAGGQFSAALANGVPQLADLGFAPTDLAALGIVPGMSGAHQRLADFRQRIGDYGRLRDFPARKGVSYLSPHLRFGTLSIRALVAEALAANADAWLNELIWRDFYFMILDHYPQVVDHAFKPEYDSICWAERPADFAAWCAGRTGYPLVDAAMRQLLHCGWMHNRLRMVAASFLCKDLGIDWRLGERHFAEQLLDYDLAANNGGWQWSASTGCDAQPYFRIFNPVTQSEKFDPDGHFIRRYVPELAGVPGRYIHAPWTMGRAEQQACGVLIGRDYPAPLVDHAAARAETLSRYAAARGKNAR